MTDPAPIPLEPLYTLTDQELDDRIRTAKQRVEGRCLVLGHHYQREEVYRFADLTGDSLKLARLASRQEGIDRLVFCGVHFMAEVADILSPSTTTVLLPDLAAGCSMADMADLPAVTTAWRELGTLLDVEQEITPVTYVNSTADLKAFCGQHGGVVCTSSNARSVLQWSLARRPRVLFFPDQHLGRNSAYRLGIPLSQMAVWNPALPLGGLSPQTIRDTTLFLWDGFCSVHQMFQPAHVELFRKRIPGIRIIVHPECSFEVCQMADAQGSTEQIQQTVRESPPGSRWAIGTELNLVDRLKHEMPDKEIHFLCPTICMCSTMFRIDPQHLCWTLENLVAGYDINPIRVPTTTASAAQIALERMLGVPP